MHNIIITMIKHCCNTIRKEYDRIDSNQEVLRIVLSNKNYTEKIYMYIKIQIQCIHLNTYQYKYVYFFVKNKYMCKYICSRMKIYSICVQIIILKTRPYFHILTYLYLFIHMLTYM